MYRSFRRACCRPELPWRWESARRTSSPGPTAQLAVPIGHRFGQRDLIVGERLRRSALPQRPKLGATTDDGDTRRAASVAAAAGLQRAVQQQGRLGGCEMCLELGIDRQFVGELGPKHVAGHDHRVNPAKPLQREIAQAAADRIADQQRARQHGRRHRHAQRHGNVNPPIVPQARQNESAKRPCHVPRTGPNHSICFRGQNTKPSTSQNGRSHTARASSCSWSVPCGISSTRSRSISGNSAR